MDSRTVNLQIKHRIWPRLREVGFGTFTSRTAWRHRPDRIDVLNFQSYNSYHASVLGCTTFSFSVNLGCFSMAIPPNYEPSGMQRKGELLLPKEFECHFRGRLLRTFKQQEMKERSTWYLDPGEKYLDQAMTDVEAQSQETVLAWFDRFDDPAFALDVLLSANEDMTALWGFGRNPSPVRHYFTGYVALQAQRTDMAIEHLGLALASGSFKTVEHRLSSDIEKAMHLTRGSA
jgi:hypothetical protein